MLPVEDKTKEYGKGRKYATVVLRLELEVFDKSLDLDDDDCQDWLETNLEGQINQALNYASKVITLGADAEGRVTRIVGTIE